MKKNRRLAWILLHVAAWLLITASIWGVLIQYLPVEYLIWKNTLAASFMIPLFYLASEFLVPRFFEKGKYLSLIVISVLILTLVVFLRYQLEEIWLRQTLHFDQINPNNFIILGMPWLRYGFSSVFPFGMGIFYRLIYREVLSQNRKNELLALQYETELKQLLHQINPHFLFNTLNNLYTLALIKDDRTAPMLLKLSDMLRTSLYQSQKERIPLEKEIDLINNLLDIYSLKYDPMPLKKLPPPNLHVEVPPLLFLPIIENMFKHGDITDSGPWKLDVFVEGKNLHFHSQNPISKENTYSEEGSGIGMTNVEKRLELLFGESHSFEKVESEKLFSVHIKFPLS